MTFRDYTGTDLGILLRSDGELTQYGLTVDGSGMATLVDATGSGDGETLMIATASDPDSEYGYPQMDAVIAYSDVSVFSTLQAHADGDHERLHEPAAVLSMAVHGEEPPIPDLHLGDTVYVDINYGPITYRGSARLLTITYGLDEGATIRRVLGVQPLDPVSEALLNQTPTDNCEDC